MLLLIFSVAQKNISRQFIFMLSYPCHWNFFTVSYPNPCNAKRTSQVHFFGWNGLPCGWCSHTPGCPYWPTTLAISSHPYRDTGKDNRAMGDFLLLSHRTAYLPGRVSVLKTFLAVQSSNMVSETKEITWQPGISLKLFKEHIIPHEFYCFSAQCLTYIQIHFST